MFRDYKNYEIYEDGRIWSYARNRWLKPTPNRKGYLRICLYDNDGKMKFYQHHRVVYESVTSQPIPEGMQVNHINENKTDNRFENLNLMTPKDNANWGTRNERAAKVRINHPLRSKQVEQYDKNGNLIQVWPSASEVERQLSYDQGHISKCCRGELKSAYGFIWKYAS